MIICWSMSLGNYSYFLKVADVDTVNADPIFKSIKVFMSNYRPVSLISCIGECDGGIDVIVKYCILID